MGVPIKFKDYDKIPLEFLNLKIMIGLGDVILILVCFHWVLIMLAFFLFCCYLTPRDMMLAHSPVLGATLFLSIFTH